MPRHYEKSLKLKVARLICDEKHSTTKTALEFGVPLKTVENWVTAYNKDRNCYNPDFECNKKQSKKTNSK